MKHGLGNVGGLAVDVLYDLTGGTPDDAIHNIAQGVYAVREPKRLLSTRILRAREGLGGRHPSSPCPVGGSTHHRQGQECKQCLRKQERVQRRLVSLWCR
jgi:hypothetical protein